MRGTKSVQTSDCIKKAFAFKEIFFEFTNNVQMRNPFVCANGDPLIHRHREPPKLRNARFGEPRTRSPFPSMGRQR